MMCSKSATATSAAILTALLAAGCTSTTAPPAQPPVAEATVEVLTLPSPRTDPGYHGICQTGALVALRADGSRDPAGQSLTYQWTDTVGGETTTDFSPSGSIRTTTPRIDVRLATIAEHEIVLLVETADGRKAHTTLRVLVTACDCGP